MHDWRRRRDIYGPGPEPESASGIATTPWPVAMTTPRHSAGALTTTVGARSGPSTATPRKGDLHVGGSLAALPSTTTRSTLMGLVIRGLGGSGGSREAMANATIDTSK